MEGFNKTCLISYFILSFVTELCVALFYNAHTDVGVFIGKIETVRYKNRRSHIISYLGIPYAEDPTDWRRFQKPRLKKTFKVPYNATYIRPSCTQTGYGQTKKLQSEACLNLNIYAPVESTVNPEKKYPVLIYIHGGHFTVGSSNDVSQEKLSYGGDVIVVTIDYRLGVFGFLSSGEYNARGNYGLWDQQMAIKWVRFNIASFGGDVERITLLGQSAGAASVMFQALYPGNRGLFQQVIAMSGTSLSPWSLYKPNAKQLGKQLDCIEKDADDMPVIDYTTLIECIRNKPVADLLKASMLVTDIGPTIDGDFFTDHPHKMLFPENGTTSDAREFFRSLNIVVGVNNDDGSRKLLSLLTSEFGISNFNRLSIQADALEQVLVPDFLNYAFDTYHYLHGNQASVLTYEHVKFAVLFQYTNWSDPDSSDNIRDNLLRLSTDVNFAMPAVQIADVHSDMNTNASTYMYQFAHQPTFNILEPAWVTGAGHGAEKLFMFGFPPDMMHQLGLTKNLVTGEEKLLAENMITWISNFAKTGNPNKPQSLLGGDRLQWPHYDTERSYFRLSTNMTASNSTKKRFGEPSTSFWLTLIPALLQDGVVFGIESTLPPEPTDSQVYYTAFQISSANVESTIVVLIAVLCVLLLLIIIIICCVCYCHS